MKKFKKLLFKTLSFKQYLTLVSRSYFILFRLGALKNSPICRHHYFLKNFINKDDIIIDIGANLGYYSVPLSDWVGRDGLVYAVEPVFQMREVLQKNIGKRKNIKVLPYALGSENKEIRMGNNSREKNGIIATGSHFVLEENAKAFDEFTAEMKRGSELFDNLKKLNFIKCDVEGYEAVIIPEIEKILAEHRPLMLVETRGEKRVFLMDFLQKLGYSGYVLKEKKLLPVSEVKDMTEDDILFIHEDQIERFNNFI